MKKKEKEYDRNNEKRIRFSNLRRQGKNCYRQLQGLGCGDLGLAMENSVGEYGLKLCSK